MIDSLRTVEFSDTLAIRYTQNENLNFIELVKVLKETNQQEKFLNIISYDALATIIIMLLIFFLGFLFERILNLIKKNYRRKAIYAAFKDGLNNLILNLNHLVESYRNVSQTTSLNTGIPSTPPKLLSIYGAFKQLNSINYEEIFDAVLIKSNLTNLINRITFAEKLFEQVDIYHDKIYNDSSILRRDLEQEIEDYIELIEEFNEKEKSENHQIYKNLNSNIQQALHIFYTEISRTSNITSFYDIVMMNILNVILKEKLYSEPDIKQIAFKSRQIIKKYEKLEIMTEEYKKDYEKFHNHANETSQRLSDNLSKLKIKRCWDF